MREDQGNAPSWLYSFVDLAFLLVIVLSLLGIEGLLTPDLGELRVPQVHAAAPLDTPDQPAERWQLRVHPAAESPDAPFELAGVGAAPPAPGRRLARIELHARLRSLRNEGLRKPLLAPHEDSRSADLLEAAGLLEAFWPSERVALVSPVVEAE